MNGFVPLNFIASGAQIGREPGAIGALVVFGGIKCFVCSVTKEGKI